MRYTSVGLCTFVCGRLSLCVRARACVCVLACTSTWVYAGVRASISMLPCRRIVICLCTSAIRSVCNCLHMFMCPFAGDFHVRDTKTETGRHRKLRKPIVGDLGSVVRCKPSPCLTQWHPCYLFVYNVENPDVPSRLSSYFSYALAHCISCVETLNTPMYASLSVKIHVIVLQSCLSLNRLTFDMVAVVVKPTTRNITCSCSARRFWNVVNENAASWVCGEQK